MKSFFVTLLEDPNIQPAVQSQLSGNANAENANTKPGGIFSGTSQIAGAHHPLQGNTAAMQSKTLQPTTLGGQQFDYDARLKVTLLQ